MKKIWIEKILNTSINLLYSINRLNLNNRNTKTHQMY